MRCVAEPATAFDNNIHDRNDITRFTSGYSTSLLWLRGTIGRRGVGRRGLIYFVNTSHLWGDKDHVASRYSLIWGLLWDWF